MTLHGTFNFLKDLANWSSSSSSSFKLSDSTSIIYWQLSIVSVMVLRVQQFQWGDNFSKKFENCRKFGEREERDQVNTDSTAWWAHTSVPA